MKNSWLIGWLNLCRLQAAGLSCTSVAVLSGQVTVAWLKSATKLHFIPFPRLCAFLFFSTQIPVDPLYNISSTK